MALEDKVIALEKFVAILEEKLELLEQAQFNIQDIDNSKFDKLHKLLRSNSLGKKCDECNYIARNEAGLVTLIIILERNMEMKIFRNTIVLFMKMV